MNEGWATYWHYTLLNRLYDEGLLSDRFMIEFLQSHTNVIYQPPYNSKWYSGLNPYALGFAMRNFKDESFIAQYLSPKLMRDFRLFSVLDDDRKPKLHISAIHDERGYRAIRQTLSEQYNLGNKEPDIQVWDVDVRGDRSLTLRHMQHHRRALADNLDQMLFHVARLWGFNVKLETVYEDGRASLTREKVAEKRRGGR